MIISQNRDTPSESYIAKVLTEIRREDSLSRGLPRTILDCGYLGVNIIAGGLAYKSWRSITLTSTVSIAHQYPAALCLNADIGPDDSIFMFLHFRPSDIGPSAPVLQFILPTKQKNRLLQFRYIYE